MATASTKKGQPVSLIVQRSLRTLVGICSLLVPIRVVAPGKVSPPLTPAVQLALTALYDEMIAAGITVLK